MVLQESEIDLRALLADAMQMIAATAPARDKQMAIRCELPAVTIVADPRLLKQVALNLLSNAVKFTPEGGRVDVSLTVGTTGAEVRIADNGIGIAQEKLDVVFHPYEHGANYVGGVKSTGLGLPIARSFTELHGGTLHLESCLGCGTTAVLRLPYGRVLTAPQSPAARAAMSAPAAPPEAAPGLKRSVQR